MKISSFHIGVSAEAIAAGLFARLGYDVSVQYGANQPEYDLIIAKGNNILKISVKGSQDGSWGLTQGLLRKGKADYHNAADRWLLKHSNKTIFCLVQYKDTNLLEMPRVYIATPKEIAERLKQTSKNKGDSILYENKIWTKRANGYGTIEKIPKTWLLSEERLAHIFLTTSNE